MENKLQNEKITIHEQKKSMRQIRWLIFWVLVSLSIANLIFDVVFSFLPTELRTSLNFNYAIMAITQVLAILIPLIIYFRISGDKSTSKRISLRLNTISAKQSLVIIFLAFAGQFIMMALNIPMEALQQTLQISRPLSAPSTGFELFIGIIVIAIIPAILEEILFRGVLFGGMERQSTIFAVMFSTFAFALLHTNMFNFLGYIFLGLMTVIVMLRTKSIYSAILYHFANNLMALIFGFLLTRRVITSDEFIVFLFIAAAVVFVVSMFIFKLVTPNAPKSEGKNSARFLFGNIFSIPILLCIIISIVVQYFRFFA